jgi:hypothetical protein
VQKQEQHNSSISTSISAVRTATHGETALAHGVALGEATIHISEISSDYAMVQFWFLFYF